MNKRFRLLFPALLLTACGRLDSLSPEQLLPVVQVLSPQSATPLPWPETPMLMCTPPACGPDEVYYCDGDCPGGCGTTCATPTPFPMCTPPACGAGETYACPTGDCPGGCGVVCVSPTPVTGPLGPAPTDWENLEAWLVTLWQSNVNPAAVRVALQQSGVQKDYADWRAADLDGDLQDEWILVLYDTSLPSAPFGSPGDLWIINGRGPVFRYHRAPSADFYEFLAPRIVDVTDLTGDGSPEIITEETLCGAHTCYSDFRIIGRTAEGLGDLVSGRPNAEGLPIRAISMSFAEPTLADTDGDGLREFLVHGGVVGSAGAGIVRPWTEVWKWDGTAFVLADTILDPTNYRHHVLYEANDRMAAGDLAGALALYEASINDSALITEPFMLSAEETYADISRFAAFRLILIDLLQGQAERATSRLAWLQATYPGSAATEAAARLIAGWAGPESLTALCTTIESSLAASENATGALANMGYGNPGLTAEDYCP